MVTSLGQHSSYLALVQSGKRSTAEWFGSGVTRTPPMPSRSTTCRGCRYSCFQDYVHNLTVLPNDDRIIVTIRLINQNV